MKRFTLLTLGSILLLLAVSVHSKTPATVHVATPRIQPTATLLHVEPLHPGYRTMPVYQQQGGYPDMRNALQPAKPSGVVLQ
jgi:hypothetical protein